LCISQHQWQLQDKDQHANWQVSQSNFLKDNQQYHLVVLTNITQAIRKTQQESWLQIIRVLSHEIHNSLTPIKSLAQSLVEMESTESRSKTALEVIVKRSKSLGEFVNRYANLYQNITVSPVFIPCSQLTKQLTTLFERKSLTIRSDISSMFVDPVLLEQVMINLIKNAIEASINTLEQIDIHFSQKANKIHITVSDSGRGIANSENIFVPFYSTKEDGSGIGLVLSRNIIEQHGGSLSLCNNENNPGATAKIILPMKEAPIE